MSRAKKIYEAALKNPRGISFADLVYLVEAAGFVFDRQKGSHKIYKRPNTVGRINLQSDGRMAKQYQVQQVIDIFDENGIVIA